MKKTFTVLNLLIALIAQSQTPKLYLNITSHNEMTTLEPYDTNSSFFTQTSDTLKKIADMVFAKGAKYNLQTCQKFVYAVHANQSAASNPNDILEYCYKLGGGSGGSVVEIDPRYKTTAPIYTLNMSDVAHMIDSTGAKSSKTVGGFIYYPYSSQDWSVYTNTITGTKYGKPWKADILWGSGSTPPHTHDANNYGVWKPKGNTDSINFYCHDPSQNVYIQGNGCAWVLYDTTTNVNWIIKDIRNAATKIANGTYPNNKFYCATLMINFKHFQSAGFRQKLTTIVDSINTMLNKITWATIGQKHSAFQAWSTANMIAYSQWACGQTATLAPTCSQSGIEVYTKDETSGLRIAPNPAENNLNVEWQGSLEHNTSVCVYDNTGRLVIQKEITTSITNIQLNELSNGIYFIGIRNNDRAIKPQKLIISR